MRPDDPVNVIPIVGMGDLDERCDLSSLDALQNCLRGLLQDKRFLLVLDDVLKLSYDHLPSRLQRCLALLSLYKKDEIYRSHEVIQLWMANGLLEHPEGRDEWEDVGDRYLNELLSRCLVQKEKDYVNYFTFRMHDLVHDLVLKVSSGP
ncbi:hypothetical protein V6N11_004916 [Hibiscus sabdariffa]|uniref:Disease resistance protein winged helix domain-containing protein n=1 Tax=Hibiscus sabdariffa TaxID=183260 RepID=A0ABR2SHI7_9ROSI